MADLEKTQHQLLSSPTAGVAGEHSAWSRRLFSAGYKGHIQGAIGGATMYGALGLAVGTVVGLAASPFTGGASLMLIPVMGGIGVVHGAESFSHIATTAAIIAEDSEISEKRRTLLDRYYDDSTGEAEKAEIQKQLDATTATKKPEHMFHWKTVLIGAAIGAAIAIGLTLLMTSGGIGIHFLLTEAAAGLGLHAAEGAGAAAAGAVAHVATPIAIATMGALGAAVGGLIGLDREYVRRWMDGAETIVAEPRHVTDATAERIKEVGKITQAAKHDQRNVKNIPVEQVSPAPAPAPTSPVPAAPTTHVNAVDLQNRMATNEHSIRVPAV